MSKTLLQLNNVTAAYGNKIVLCETNLRVAQNDSIIISGPNGGGKTTLLKLLAGLVKPSEGTITCQEGLVTGYLPQYRGIDRAFPITVEETVLSGLNSRKAVWKAFSKVHKERVEELLEAFHLTDLAKRSIDTLSGGQWQRTLIARSLASDPDLWLLDEPDTHLDAESQDYLHQKITDESGKRAIVVVTHNPEHLSHLNNQKNLHVHEHHVHIL